MGGVFPIYYNITIGGEGSTGTPNLYYVINGRPLMNLIGFIKHEIAKVVEMVENGAKIACFKLEMRG